MIEVVEWGRLLEPDDRPWLVLGKGPSFGCRDEFDLSRFRLFALNHVVRELAVDVAHAIDVDVIEAGGEQLREHCRWLVMPRFPHVNHRPTRHPLEHFVARIPVLDELDREGRLVWYNLDWAAPAPGSPIIPVRYFSSEAALSILGLIGVKEVRSLGIDGGRRYSTAFSTSTLLANRQPSFDLQFDELARITKEYGMDYAPLVEPLQVFIGCDPSQEVAAAVLEHSIVSRCSRPVQVRLLPPVTSRAPQDPRNHPRTKFSFSRFLIPGLCDFRGKALYLDADMQVFGDIAELWRIPFDDKKVLCTSQPVPDAWKDNPGFRPGRQMSVMLLDCERLDWDVDRIIDGLDQGEFAYEDLMFDLCIVPPDEIDDRLPPEWNHLERYEPGATKLVHYTVVPTQPWKNDDNPLREVWHEGFRAALADGAIDPSAVKALAAAGEIKPSLADAVTTSWSERLQIRVRSINRESLRRRIIRVAAKTRLLELTRPIRRRPPRSSRRTHRELDRARSPQ